MDMLDYWMTELEYHSLLFSREQSGTEQFLQILRVTSESVDLILFEVLLVRRLWIRLSKGMHALFPIFAHSLQSEDEYGGSTKH